MAVDLFEQTAAEEVLEQQNARENRYCKITVNDTGARPLLDLSWHTGMRGRQSILRVKAGETVTLPIGKAQAFFGHFTLPHDAKDARNDAERDEMRKLFYDMRTRVLMQWGGYPMPRKLEDGDDPTGPHRFPDVTVTVIEQDGTEWEPIRLYEMYGLGEFDVNTFEPKVKPEVVAAEKQAMRAEIDALKAQIATLIDMITPKVVSQADVAAGSPPHPSARPKQS